MLVKVLTGVFDPPPAALSLPWAYLGLVAGLAAAGAIIATLVTIAITRRPAITTLRDL
jgi:putative ABC transport system permease protein